MAFEDVRRSAVSAQLLLRFAADRGVSPETCLRETGLSAEELARPSTEISAALELHLIRNMLAALGHPPGLGLDAGLRYHLSTYGIWGFALLASPTLRAVLDTVDRFLDLSYAFVRFRTTISREVVRTVLDDSGVPEDMRQFFVEREFAAWSNATQELRPGGVPVLKVRFRFARPPYAARFRQLCGIEPEFGAADNAIWLDPAMLDLPLPQGNPDLARMCLQQCRQLLDKRKLRTGVAGQVRDQLFHMAGTMPTLETVAGKLNMSPRSLRRHLEAEHTSFRTLAEEVLEALAEELLTVAHMKLEEVAMRLGYAEPASFIHAFKRWKGVSPSAFREQHKAQAL